MSIEEEEHLTDEMLSEEEEIFVNTVPIDTDKDNGEELFDLDIDPGVFEVPEQVDVIEEGADVGFEGIPVRDISWIVSVQAQSDNWVKGENNTIDSYFVNGESMVPNEDGGSDIADIKEWALSNDITPMYSDVEIVKKGEVFIKAEIFS